MKFWHVSIVLLGMSAAGYLYAEGIPFHSVSSLNKDTVVVVKFIADTQEIGADESFPTFICEPNEGDYIHGFTGKWYVVTRRTHDWMGRPGRSQPQFTIFVDRTDPPPKTAEGECK